MMNQSDKWEFSYVSNLPDAKYVVWDDASAFLSYPKHNYVYDKLLLSQHGGVKCWDLEKELPSLYPVFVKPRMNFDGLSKNAYIAHSPDEIEDYQGYIAQEYLQGMQFTTDLLVDGGNVKAHYTFITQTNTYGEIKLFTSTPFFNPRVAHRLKNILKGFTGPVNVEYIDDKIIEIHLRPSLQFADICGGFTQAVPEFVISGKIKPIQFEQTFSRVYRTRHDGKPSVLELPDKPEAVRSVQFTWEDNKKLSETDPSLFRKRYMVVNGTDLSEIEKFGSEVRIRVDGC